MFRIFNMFSINFLIICGLYMNTVDSVLEEGQSSEMQSAETSSATIIRKTDPANSIFCDSDILRDVQMSNTGPFSDPKYFVSLKLKDSKDDTLTKYAELKSRVDVAFEETELETFVRDNFEEDKPNKCQRFQDSLSFQKIQSGIADEEYKAFHSKINEIWPDCAMETDADVAKRPEYHSLLDVPECYIQIGNSNSMPTYLQNYLIVRGTLANAMRATPSGIMRNIAHLIKKHGMALYSNTTYYSTRTQSPVLAILIEDYLEAAEEDDVFLKELLPAVAKDFIWWYDNRSFKKKVNGKEYIMFSYKQSADRPRPEHHWEDSTQSKLLPSEDVKTFFANLYSLDESGFEYTTRFRRAKPDGKGSYLDIMNVVPVELMSVLHRCASLLSSWYASLIKRSPPMEAQEYKQEIEKHKFGEKAEEILKTITEVLYDKKKGTWFDFNADTMKPIEVFYPTNLLPLMTSSYDLDHDSEIGNRALTYLISEGIINKNLEPNYFVIPTSKEKNGGPGDYPSGSLHLNLLIIEGLNDSDNYGAQVAARELASILLKTIYVGFKKHGVVLENYGAVANDYMAANPSQHKISPAAVGGVNLLLKWFGSDLKATDYDDFAPKTEESRKRPIDSISATEMGESSGNAEEERNKKSHPDA